MSSKRRQPKRRIDHMAEIRSWETVIECGIDYFGDLISLGYSRSDRDRVIKDAKDVWFRIGYDYMGVRDKRYSERFPKTWAEIQFGPAPGMVM